MAERWLQLARGVFVARHDALDLNLGLVVGAERCLVIDTGFGQRHGAALAEAVRERTTAPWSVALTHAHLDHCLGTAAFGTGPELPVYAHPECARTMSESTDPEREQWSRFLRAEGLPDEAEQAGSAPLVEPTEAVEDQWLDLGGRSVRLLHPGRGHTGGDLVIHVPDAATVFAGDLVEQGAEPQAGEDAYPGEWPATLDALLALRPHSVVPGHGEPVDAAFVRAQRDELAARR